MGFDIQQLRDQFPILKLKVNGHDLVYLDNAATTQKPQAVIDTLEAYYADSNSNVHRGAHFLSDQATAQFEEARKIAAHFLNASSSNEIIWTRGTTEAINLVAHGYSQQLTAGDEIIISEMEHHSNIVPWQLACERSGATLKVIPVLDDGSLDQGAYQRLLTNNTKLVAVTAVSNALGIINPIQTMIEQAHAVGAKVLIDGAQSVAHWPTDVQELDCDFFTFSGHKVFGPTGIGVLYGKEALLEQLPPYQFGGEMIETVTLEKSTWNQLPFKFEAGTPNISGAIGLGTALRWLQSQDRQQLAEHEARLLHRINELASQCSGLRIFGQNPHKVAVFSFLLEGGHPNDVGTLLDQQGIAVRTGHHCTMPLMQRFNIPGTVRASFSIYNTLDEVERLFAGIEKVKTFL